MNLRCEVRGLFYWAERSSLRTLGFINFDEIMASVSLGSLV